MNRLNDDTFDVVINSEGPYLVLFSVYYCGQCKNMARLMELYCDTSGIPCAEVESS